MDAALELATQRTVEADDLMLLKHVDTYGYVCHGHECGIQVFPRSYRPENLQRPHFSLPKGATHEPNCDVKGEDELRSRGKKGSIAGELETSPGLSPASLRLVDTRVVVSPLATAVGGNSHSGSRSTTPGEARHKPAGRRAANSIRPICRAFLEFPYDRHLPLHIDRINTTTYQTVFKRLRGEGIKAFPQQRIFYEKLAWGVAQESEEGLLIPLDAGEWENKLLVRPYRVLVRWADWSQTARTRLRNELELARRENMAADKAKAEKKTFLFFIGAQNPNELSQFVVSDQRLICSAHGELFFPKQK
ncbi:hypothetical protein IB260_05705 [Pseudomonas sp. PDM23]|uniref:hypothetical protein n=1 Tax=Pseudomonas sp. PDM23 TaxID=2769275 RepID=UPI00178161B4|nr:hypothetical protein [Pseudomonas sp. PDM23]MBD9574800.1 hypothetical protein [Pseudomonas sp. PDM23]